MLHIIIIYYNPYARDNLVNNMHYLPVH